MDHHGLSQTSKYGFKIPKFVDADFEMKRKKSMIN